VACEHGCGLMGWRVGFGVGCGVCGGVCWAVVLVGSGCLICVVACGL